MKNLYGKIPLLGFLLLTLWLSDLYVKFFVLHTPYRILWFCSVGLLLTSIALFARNSMLATAMFCALFTIESLWVISFISFLLFHADIFGMITYQASNRLDMIVGTSYHLLLLPSLLVSLFVLKPHPFGWIVAAIFAFAVGILSVVFTEGGDNVNCVLSDATCSQFFAPLYALANPTRILAGVFLMTLLIFFPLNKLLIKFNS